MDETIILETIKTIEETKKQILNKLSQNNDLKEKIELINQLKEIDNNLIYYDNLLKKKGKQLNTNIIFQI